MPPTSAEKPATDAPPAPRARPGVRRRVRRWRERPPLPPGPGTRQVGRWVARIQKQEGPLDFLDQMGVRFGDVAMLRNPRQNVVVVRGAEACRHVLLGNQDNYRKSNQYELLRPGLGLGLVTSEGDLWKRQRRLVQPMFAKRHLSAFADHMALAAVDGLAERDARWREGQAVEIAEEVLDIGLDTVGRALVGTDFLAGSETGIDPHVLGTALGTALHEIGAIGRSAGVTVGQYVPGMGMGRAARATQPARWRRYLEQCGIGDRTVEALVAARRRDGHGETADLLQLLMEAVDDETGEPMSDRQIRDEMITFVAAGHETTAHGLAWMYHLLAQHPEAREAMEREVDEVLGGRVPTADEADAQLPWTTACFQEAMRLYPPVWHVQRTANADDEIGGYRIPRNALVLVSIWSTHRDPNVWPNPTAYDPRRWLGDAPKQRPRFSFIPFAGGRRACVGQGFAMLNATILAATVAQRFRFEGVPSAKIVLDPTVTLRPLHGIPMTVHRRTDGPALVAPEGAGARAAIARRGG